MRDVISGGAVVLVCVALFGCGGGRDADRRGGDAGATDGGGRDGGDTDPWCPAYEPREGATECRDAAECAGIGSCYAPDTGCCSTSVAAPRVCEVDDDCTGDEICEEYEPTDACTFGLGTRCVADCRTGTDPCPEGHACDDTGRCTALQCPDAWTCESNFDCDPGAAEADVHGCARRTCSTDGECDCGACVTGACHDGPGACRPDCACAAPDTLVATPGGERAIADLRMGDLVFSVDREGVIAVPIVRTNRVAVSEGHQVARVHLADGRNFEMTPGHPTADGRSLGDLSPGDLLGDVRVTRIEIVSYAHPYTYDILPASSTGSYFAAGALVGSTLMR